MSSFSLKGPNGEWSDNKNINYMGVDYSPQLILDNNYVSNLKEIEHWAKPCEITMDPAIIVSAGPSCDFAKIKLILRTYPNAKVFCVKHAYPKLLREGIVPWACVIVDARMLEGVSSWGQQRSNLIKDADKRTTFFVQSQSHPSYVKYIKEREVPIMGFITTASEIFRILGYSDVKDIPDQIRFEIEQSTVVASGSCAATCAIPLALHLGFRKFHLFGYDGNVLNPPENDRHEYCFETKCRGVTYWIPKEFVMMGMEMEQIYRTYPRKYNVQFSVYGGEDSFCWAVHRQVRQEVADLQKREAMLKNPLIHCQDIKAILDTKKYFNKPFADDKKVLLGYPTYADYVDLQIEGFQKTKHLVMANREIMKDVAALLREHAQGDIRMGVCHGVRTGLENKWLSEELGIDVAGTDICNEAVELDKSGRTICWDFNDLKDEWIQRLDFVYSNSINHSYNPRYCLDQWLLCLKPGGMCVIEWCDSMNSKDKVNKYRPFGTDNVNSYVEYIQEKYAVKVLVKKRPQPITDAELNPVTPPLDRHIILIRMQRGDRIELGS